MEVQDVRTQRGGFAARKILQFLIRMEYEWFVVAAKGSLPPISYHEQTHHANLVALPVEQTEEFLNLLGQK